MVDLSGEVAQHTQYVQKTDPELFVELCTTANIVERNANGAYRQLALRHGVHIPVDTSRELETQETLKVAETEAGRAAALPHIVISANHVPVGADEALVNHIDVIERFQKNNSELPVSHFTRHNAPGTPIGITRDLIAWSNILLHLRRSRAQGVPFSDVPLTNWDADTLGATPGYFDQIQERHADSTAEVFAAGPLVVHEELDPDRFPAANRLLRWHDSIQLA